MTSSRAHRRNTECEIIIKSNLVATLTAVAATSSSSSTSCSNQQDLNAIVSAAYLNDTREEEEEEDERVRVENRNSCMFTDIINSEKVVSSGECIVQESVVGPTAGTEEKGFSIPRALCCLKGRRTS